MQGRGAAGDDEALSDLERMKAPEHVIEAMRNKLAGTALGVWPENWDIVQAFVSVQSQWRTAFIRGRTVATALDYAGARAGIEAAGFTLTPELWRGVQAMEFAAADAIAGYAR